MVFESEYHFDIKKKIITAVYKVHEFCKELSNFVTPWNLQLGLKKKKNTLELLHYSAGYLMALAQSFSQLMNNHQSHHFQW